MKIKVHYWFSEQQKKIVQQDPRFKKLRTVKIKGVKHEYTESHIDDEDRWHGKVKPPPPSNKMPPMPPHSERFSDSIYLGYTEI